MRFLLLLALLLVGCGGASSPGVGSTASTASTGTATVSGKGIAVSVRVKQLPNRVVRRGEEIEQVVLDVLDPVTLQSEIPVTIVRREPGQVSQSVRLEVPPGRWLLRVQGRTADGQAAGTRVEEIVPVAPEQVTAVQAELNPLTDLTGLQISPAPQFRLAPGTSLQLTATGIRSDLTSENVTNNVAWSSSAASVATVSSTGLVTAAGLGTAVLTARTGNLSAFTTVTVTQVSLTQLQVTPSGLLLSTGMSRALTATGIFSDNTSQDLTSQVTWSTSDSSRATVTSTGLVTALAPGNATITARQGAISATSLVSVQASLTRLELTPGNVSLPVGKTQAVKATGFFSDGTSQDLTASVNWTSSAPAVATVDAAGVVQGRSQGTADVTAASGNVTASAGVTVRAAELSSMTVTPAGVGLPKGAARAFRATGTFTDGSTRDLTDTATWTSTNSSVLVVSNANGTRGQATGANVGRAFVEASQDALTGAAAVNVTAAELVALDIRPVNPILTRSFATLQFQVVGRFTDATEVDLTSLATWTSSKPEVAGISNASGSQGLATALANGITAIQVASGNVTNATALRVDIPGPPPAPSATPLGRLFASSNGTPSEISFVGTGASGATPLVTNITGPATTISFPTDVAVDHARGLLYGAQRNSNQILVWPLGATGNVAPLRVINGSTFTNPIFVDSVNDRLYVHSSTPNDRINIYNNASTLTGTPTPTRSITAFGGIVRGITVDVTADRMFVAVGGSSNKIDVFDNISTKDGTAAATVDRVVQGGATLLSNPHTIFLDPTGQKLFVANFDSSSITVFANAATMNGNVAPVNNLTGPATLLPANPNAMVADFSRNQLYVSSGATILVFPTAVTGNTAPQRTFTIPGSADWLDFDPNL